jgi:hypothetical protein
MNFENPISFRFNFFPFLKENILPEYKNILNKELRSSVVFSEFEIESIKLYIKFLSNILERSIHFPITKKELDINTIHPIFEMMEKHIIIFDSVLKRIDITEEEKKKILLQFQNKKFISNLLGNSV